MNRRLAVLMITGAAVFGLTACAGGSGDDSPAAPSSSAAAEQPAETTTSEQSVAEACLSMAGPLQDAATTMSGLADAGSDPQSAVDAWTALVDAYQSVSASVTNEEVKGASVTVHEDTAAVRDAIAKIYVDGDTAAVEELVTATTDMQASLTALTELCAA